jgi:acyl-activating enzyme 14
MLSHASINHQSLVKLAVVQYSSSDTYLHMAPLFHIGGLSSAFAVLMAGGAHVFMPRYSPATALQLIQQHHVTSLIAVPAMMQDLTQAAAAAAGTPATPQQQLPSLQKVLVGAGGMPLRLQRAVAALFPNAVLQTAYGMTEASSSMTIISVAQQQQQQQQLLAQAAAATASAGRGAGAVPQDCHDAAADGGGGGGVCVGKPGPGIAVRIASPAGSATNGGNHQQQQDVVGEVCTLGPHVMLGYWRDPQATAQTLQSEGWLHTGDLGYLDSKGHLWLVGRLKDMVKTGGENVHAAEVEGVLLTHPAVAAAAVFGLEHRRLGEQVAAAVVLQPGWGWGDAGTVLLPQQQPHDSQAAGRNAPQQQQCGVLTAAVLQQHCRDALLSPFKLPRVVVCAQQLPLNSSGKVVKAWLKQQVQQLLLKGGQGVQQSTPAQRSRL